MDPLFGSRNSFAVDPRSLRPPEAGSKWDALLATLNAVLRSNSQPEGAGEKVVHLLCDSLKVDRVTYLDINEAEGRISISMEAVRSSLNATVGEYEFSDFLWAMEVFKRGSCLEVGNTQGPAGVPEEARASIAALGIVGWIGAPVLQEGVVVGALCASVSSPRHWSRDELWLLCGLADRIWATALQARTAQALQAKSIELKHQSAQLRRLSADLTLAEHNTRQLLSKTLHDGLQQFLVASKFALDSAIAQTGPTELLLRAKTNLMEAIDAARSLSVDLFPPVLHNNGLPEALEWLAAWMHKKYGKEVTVEAHAEADPGAIEARILMFESVRELIFNSVKHANTPTILVRASDLPGFFRPSPC